MAFPPRRNRLSTSSMHSSTSQSHPSRPKPVSRTIATVFPKKRAAPRPTPTLIALSLFVVLVVAFFQSSCLPSDAAQTALVTSQFDGDLTVEELQTYYRQGVLRFDGTQARKLSGGQVVMTDNVDDKLLTRCTLIADHSTIHESLRRKPDKQELAGRKFAKQPRDFDEVFSVIDRRRFYFNADRPAVHTVDLLGAGLDTDLDDAIRVAKGVMERDVGGELRNVAVPMAYMRTTRRDGTVTIVNIGGEVNGTEGMRRMRRMVSVSKGFGKGCEVGMVRPREVVKMHVLVPYSRRRRRLEAFLKLFKGYFEVSGSELVKIVVATTEEEKGEVEEIGRGLGERLEVVSCGGDRNGNFSRAVALREAAKLVPGDEILFMADADLVVGGNFLQNCRTNVVRGSQVWFPVMFSLFPYGKGLSSRDGFWRRSSYGMACMYGEDFEGVGGFGGGEEDRFLGWGSEDVALYNRFRDGRWAVLRSLEPGLQHLWHGKECERNEHFVDCMRTVYMTIGSQEVIAQLMTENNVDISNLTKKALPV